MHQGHLFWNASLAAPPARLRADYELLPEIAEAGLCAAAKDGRAARAANAAARAQRPGPPARPTTTPPAPAGRPPVPFVFMGEGLLVAVNPVDESARPMTRISICAPDQWQGKPRKCRASCTHSWMTIVLPNSDTMPSSTPTR